MKKQFFRVKQLADQTFSRAGKTEVLTDDLQDADRHVEFLRNACTNTNKKLAACLLGMGADDAAREKRMKKCPEFLLGHAMKDTSSCEDDFLLKHVLATCGTVEMALAYELVELDIRVEQLVVNPLQALLDTEIPSILKHKRNLARLTLDMDSARTRYQTATKHSAGNTAGTAKVDSIREDLEETESKVEQCRDALASEMFQLIARETELANTVAQYVKLQKSYHEKALKFLENMIPDLETYIKDSSMKPVFGFPLEEHLRVTDRKIALPIELCVCALLELGMEEEGLFRVAGGASKVRRMRMSLDASCLSLQTALDYSDPHVIAGTLKSYLRELPEPLMTHTLYNDWMSAARIQSSSEERLRALNEVMHRLPEANRDNLRYLIKFLATLARNQEVNKMTPQNIAIVIAPNLMWTQTDETNGIGMNMSTANIHSFIVDNLVTFADYFFPGESEFYLTFTRSEPVIVDVQVHRLSMINGQTGSTEPGHSRSSSNDTALIITGDDIKRTQSNSSLTENTSPPHSPKPVTRRKNKVAPTPPVTKETVLEKPDKPPRPAAVHNMQTVVSTVQHPTHPPPPQPTLPPPPQHTLLSSTQPSLHPVQPSTQQPMRPKPSSSPPASKSSFPAVNQSAASQSNAPQSPQSKVSQSSQTTTSHLVQHPAPQPRPLSRDKDVTELKQQEIGESSVEVRRISVVDLIDKETSAKPQAADVLEQRSKPPVAMPRTIVVKEQQQDQLEGDKVLGDDRPKPAIPERPASLRSHGSFHVSRREEKDATPAADKTTDTPSKMVHLERAHMYSVDKQQVSIVQVGADKTSVVPKATPRPLSLHEKRESVDKPERPPKPEHIGGEKANYAFAPSSDSAEEDLGEVKQGGKTGAPSSPRGLPFRPPRPQPPPPPPKQQVQGGAPASESTDL